MHRINVTVDNIFKTYKGSTLSLWHTVLMRQGSMSSTFYQQLSCQQVYTNLTGARRKAYSVEVQRIFQPFIVIKLSIFLLVKLNGAYWHQRMTTRVIRLMKLTPALRIWRQRWNFRFVKSNQIAYCLVLCFLIKQLQVQGWLSKVVERNFTNEKFGTNIYVIRAQR